MECVAYMRVSTEKQAEATENAADVNEEVAGNQEQEETVSEVDDKKEGKKIFKGKEKSEKKKDKNKEKIEELEDKVKRQMAEFDNFRKRSEKEKAAMFELGARSIIEKILPVIDNFERGFATVEEEVKVEKPAKKSTKTSKKAKSNN